MILIEIEDHANGIKTLVQSSGVAWAHRQLTARGFKFLWKGDPLDYTPESCAWSMMVDGEGLSAMVIDFPKYNNVSQLPKDLVKSVRELRINPKKAMRLKLMEENDE